ncbi:hypothetical protein TWF696_000064 [Orbilia brochopaga]|uniref:Uncharacterized protein n=1 Tax=Orbilia brochopaga TaxID=3140254 RepID=A0AAV9VAL3_9PEZI
MLGLLRSCLFDPFSPIKPQLPSLSSSTTTASDNLEDLDFDIYEFDNSDNSSNNNTNNTNSTLSHRSAFFGFDTYDWAFSFRESTKTKEKVVLEVSVERIPKEAATPAYETCCLPVSPTITPHTTGSEMTLVRGSSSSSASSTPREIETADLISEEEQNMILAAIIASQCDDFDRQIPKHMREEMEHAEYVAALEESKELARQAEQRAAASIVTPPPTPGKPMMRAATFGAAPTRDLPPSSSSSTYLSSPPRSLARTNSDIPWTDKQGEPVEGESEKQQRFRELLQFHAVAAASIANASARTGFSNISGNADASDYDWLG